MNYEIIDYRPVMGCSKTGFWMVDVKVKFTEKFLFIFNTTKVKWMSCGKDGQPRLYHKIALFGYYPTNRLLVVDSKEIAEQKIREFKNIQNWQHLKTTI